MENSIAINLSPLQLLLSLVFQLWIIIFPIILIKKLNYLTYLFEEQYNADNQISEDNRR